jgi:flagellar motor switch protein FliN/FliY
VADDSKTQPQSDPSAEEATSDRMQIDALLSGAAEDASALEQPSTGDAAIAPEEDTGFVDKEAPSTSGTIVQEDVAVTSAVDGSTEELPSGGRAGAASSRVPPARSEARPFEPRELGAVEIPAIQASKVSILSDVKLKVKIELGRTSMLVEDVLELGEGSVVELDKLAGDPVEVYANERLVARGEVLILNDNFCVRISEVLSNDPHRVTT